MFILMIKKLSIFIISVLSFFIFPNFSSASISVSTLPIQPSQFSTTLINGKPITGFTAFDGYQTDCSGYSEYVRYYNENVPDTSIFQSAYTSSNFTIDQFQGLNSLTYRRQINKGSCVSQPTSWVSLSAIPIRTYIPSSNPLNSNTFITSQNLVLKSGSATSFFSNYGFTVGANPLFLANYELPSSGLIITSPSKQLVKNLWETKEYINQRFTFIVVDPDNSIPNSPLVNVNTRFYVFKFSSSSDRTNWVNPQKICDSYFPPLPTFQFYSCELTHTEQTNAYYQAVAVVEPQSPSLDLPFVEKLNLETNYNVLINNVDTIVNPYDSVLSDLLNTFPTRPAFNCEWTNLICIAEYLVKPYQSDFEPIFNTIDKASGKMPFGFIIAGRDFFTAVLPEDDNIIPPNLSINIFGSNMSFPFYSIVRDMGDITLGLPFSFRDMTAFSYWLFLLMYFVHYWARSSRV